MRTLYITLITLLFPYAAMAQSYSTFTEVLNAMGAEGLTDVSTEASIRLEEPRLAYVNITGITSLPTQRTQEKKVTIEVCLPDGTYFQKRALLHLHGNYSTRFPKRSFTVNFCEDEWEGLSTTSLEIGNWVEQDGFIFMAFYTDFLRGIGEVGYKAYLSMRADSPTPWQAAGIKPSDERAICVPDGFPCAVYLNDSFHGLYAWQLKKQRKNMGMKKHTPTHIHLDGDLRDDLFFRGKIAWNRFEVRNPKDLTNIYGNPYDNNFPTELSDSLEVKRHIVGLSTLWDELNQLETSGADTLQMKAEIARHLDIPSLLDYYIFFRVQMNGDGTLKNWQWFTYDGQKWFVTPYDLDQTMGLTIYGFPRPASLSITSITSGPYYWIDRYFRQEENERYHALRQSGALCPSTFLNPIHDWHDRIGEPFYELEQKRWPESPCYLPPICSGGWQLSDRWDLYASVPEYSATATYQPGDFCRTAGRIWQATFTIRGVQPYVRNSGEDSLERLLAWVDERFEFVDAFYGYNATENTPRAPHSDFPQRPSAIYDLQGRPAQTALKGLYIQAGRKILR